MTPRHAASLALVGWYLMAPPYVSGCLPRTAYRLGLIKKVPVSLDTDAPLAKWDNQGSFDSAKECEQQKTEEFERWNKPNSHELSDQILEAQCIATDDPRLGK
jgi:hypothetical protein